MNDIHNMLQTLLKDKTEVKVFIIDNLERYKAEYVNGNIPMHKLVNYEIREKLERFEELIRPKGKTRDYHQVYFSSFPNECNLAGLYNGMDFEYVLTDDNLVVDSIYDNFVLFKTVVNKVPFTVLEADLSRINIKRRDVQ